MAALQKLRPAVYPQHFTPVPTPEPPKPQPSQRNPRQVFISHAHEDSDFAYRLASDLEAHGWQIWIAPESIRPGEMWVEAIDRGLEESSVFVLVLTPKAIHSRWVKRETNAAMELEHEEKMRVIPLELEPCALPPTWRTYQRIFFKADYETGFQALVRELEPGVAQSKDLPPQTLPPPPRSKASPDAASPTPVASGDAPSSRVVRSAVSPDTASPSKGDKSIEIPYINIPGNTYIHEKTGLVMVRIPAGEFLYGEKKEKLYLPEFWISKTPVTQSHYQKFIEANPDHPIPYRSEDWAKSYNWNKKSRAFPPNKKDHPVVLVSWHDAVAFAQWVGLKLPTEQQWEKAARGKEGRVYPWGDKPPTVEQCNFGGNVGGTTPVGQYSPQGDSPYGCVDMSGNVWERMDSWYDESKTGRVVRGGSWYHGVEYCRVTVRYDYFPDDSSLDIGFRLVSPVVSGS